MTDHPDIDVQVIRERLLARRAELESAASDSADRRAPVTLDQTMVGRLSRMDAMQIQAMEQEAQRRRTLDLQRIRSALQRIDAGEYGYCVACEEPIAIARLEFDPSLPTCVRCAP
jgi:DnaK suppressor protein